MTETDRLQAEHALRADMTHLAALYPTNGLGTRARVTLAVMDERDRLRQLVASLSDRLAAASAVLSRCAERGAVVRCLRCSACRGRGGFELSPVCHWCAGSGLELSPDAAGVVVRDDPEADLARLADDGSPLAGDPGDPAAGYMAGAVDGAWEEVDPEVILMSPDIGGEG